MLQARWYEGRNDFTEEEKKKAWDETAQRVKEYSDELVERWNKEIDTLLVYVCVVSVLFLHVLTWMYLDRPVCSPPS